MVTEEDLRKLRAGIRNFTYYSYPENKGKGYALRFGIARVTTESVIYTDIDFPYTTGSFINVSGLLAAHDVVIGIKNSNYYHNVPLWRKRISKLLQKMISIFFPGIITTDTQCGLKGFKGKAKDIFLATTINNYLFDLEFIVLISRELKTTTVLKEIELAENVRFVPVSLTTLGRELFNFLKIIFRRRRPDPGK